MLIIFVHLHLCDCFVFSCSDDEEESENFFCSGGSPAAMKRLLKGRYSSSIIRD